MGFCGVLLAPLPLVCSVEGIPECSSGGSSFIQIKSKVSMRRTICAHSLGWNVCKQLLPFPQFAMVGLFVWMSYPDLPRQAWHLPLLPSVLFPQAAQWNLVRCADSKPFTSV